jgi:hypothetical protein
MTDSADSSCETPVTSEAVTGAGIGTTETLEADSPGHRLDEFPPMATPRWVGPRQSPLVLHQAR